MQILVSLLWVSISEYCFCNSITNLHLRGQSVPSTLNFLQGLQMIKQITCLHLSKLTLLGSVTETVLHTKEQGCTYKWGKYTWIPWPRLPSAPSTLPPLSISKAFLRSKVWHLKSYRSYHAVQGERDLGVAQVLRGDAWGRNQKWRKGKITVTRGETSLGKPGLWWQEGQVTCKQGAVCVSSVPCLFCWTANLLQLFLGPLFGSHVYLQDMESDHRSQGLVGLWCQQSRVWASAGQGIITLSTKLDWLANRQSGLGNGTGHTGWVRHLRELAAGGTKKGPRWAAGESVVFRIGSWAHARV